MRVPSVLAAGLLVTALATPRAHAADAIVHPFAGHTLKATNKCEKIDANGTETARKFYDAGRAYYEQAKLDKALDNFFSAYELDCERHDILIIISRSYERDGNVADAIRTLEEYVKRSADRSPEHKATIENLKERYKKEEAAAAALRANQKPPTPPREHTVPPWILVGVGGAALATGTVLMIVGYGGGYPEGCDPDTHKCTNPANNDKAGTVSGIRTAGPLVLIGGGVLTLGGLLWHFLEPTGPVEGDKSDKSARVRVTPAFAPGYAGASLDARF